MPQTCSVCKHPERAAIDSALVAGEPLRDIAGRFSLGKSSLARHKLEHLPDRLPLEADPVLVGADNLKKEDTTMHLKKSPAPKSENEKLELLPDGSYLPLEDITMTLPDGRGIQLAVKGIRLTREQALRGGLVPLKPGEQFPDGYTHATNRFLL